MQCGATHPKASFASIRTDSTHHCFPEQRHQMSAVQRLLPVMLASQNSGVGQIAVIPSSIATHFQRLVYGEKLTSGRGSVKLALDASSHGTSSDAIDPKRTHGRAAGKL